MTDNKNTSTTNNKSQSVTGWFIVVIASLFYLYQFMIRVSPNIMNDEIREVLVIDAAVLGTIIGAYYWAYSFMQIPLGILMDRFGPRYFLGGASLLCSLACFIFGSTTDPYVAGASRFLMGMGSACGLIGTIKLGTIWLEPKHVAKVTATTILMGTVGAGLGGTPLNLILDSIGFEYTMMLLGLLGIVIAFIIFLSVRVHPPIDHHEELPDIYGNKHPLENLMSIAKNYQAWILAVYGMLMYIPITIIGIAWGVSFVERACDTSESVAASVVSTMFLGAAIGSPVFALLSDYLKSRKIPMIMGSLITAFVWFAIIWFKIDLPIMYVLFFIAGFAYTAKCLTFASICELMPRHMSGVSLAFINMIVMATGIIFHPLIGKLLDHTWDGVMVDNIKYYSEGDYRFALMVIPVSLAISAFILLFMKESHPESSIVKDYGCKVIDTDVL